MSRYAGRVEALQRRHDYLVDALVQKDVSATVKSYWRSEVEGLAWAIPLLTSARSAIDELLRARQRIENGWREAAFAALSELAILDPDKRESIVRRMPPEVAESLRNLDRARRL